MALKALDGGGTLRTITSLKALDGATLRTIRTLKAMDADGTTLRTVATFSPPMTASASPATVTAEISSPTPASATTNAATITPSGGTPPYTYSGVVLSFTNAETPVVNSPMSATSTITQPNLAASDFASAAIRYTVTDSLGQTATADFDATFLNTSGA